MKMFARNHLFVSRITGTLAPGVGQIIRKLGDGEWGAERLTGFLANPCWWEGGNDDDRGIALLAMPIPQPGQFDLGPDQFEVQASTSI